MFRKRIASRSPSPQTYHKHFCPIVKDNDSSFDSIISTLFAAFDIDDITSLPVSPLSQSTISTSSSLISPPCAFEDVLHFSPFAHEDTEINKESQNFAYQESVTEFAHLILYGKRPDITKDISSFRKERDGRHRLALKNKKVYASILPSTFFSSPKKFDDQIRESIDKHEDYRQFDESFAYLWNLPKQGTVTDIEFSFMVECIQELLNNGKIRPLWSIVQLKNSFVNKCQAYHFEVLQEQMESRLRKIASCGNSEIQNDAMIALNLSKDIYKINKIRSTSSSP